MYYYTIFILILFTLLTSLTYPYPWSPFYFFISSLVVLVHTLKNFLGGAINDYDSYVLGYQYIFWLESLSFIVLIASLYRIFFHSGMSVLITIVTSNELSLVIIWCELFIFNRAKPSSPIVSVLETISSLLTNQTFDPESG